MAAARGHASTPPGRRRSFTQTTKAQPRISHSCATRRIVWRRRRRGCPGRRWRLARSRAVRRECESWVPLAFCMYGPWRSSIRKNPPAPTGTWGPAGPASWYQEESSTRHRRRHPELERRSNYIIWYGRTTRGCAKLLTAIASRPSGSPISRLTKPRPMSGEGGGSGAGDQGWGSCRRELIASEQFGVPAS